MAGFFTTTDLTRLEAASRALLRPLATSAPEHWLLDAGPLVRDLLGGDRALFVAPGRFSGLFSDEAPDVAALCNTHIAAATAEGMAFTDPVVDTWHDLRRQTGQEAFSWDTNARMVEAVGHRILDGPIVADGLVDRGYRDFAGLIKTTPLGDAMVWVLSRTHGGFRFADPAAVLQVLVPAFRAGLDALTRLSAHRAALDAVAEPLAAYSVDGRLLFRNTALTRVLADDPERQAVEAALGQIAGGLRRLAFPLRHEGAVGPPPLEREVRTARARYALRAALAPAGTFATDEAALVSVAIARAPAPPDPDALRDRFGLTRREAEVAVLLAAGLPNEAIADRLFIAPGTARRHTEGVFAKLGVGSRAAAAARVLSVG